MRRLPVFLLLLLTAGFLQAGDTVKIEPAETVIVLPPNAGGVMRIAAYELQKHLKLITGVEIPVADKTLPGKYTFRFEVSGKGGEQKPEEAFYEIRKDAVFFRGDDSPFPANAPITTILCTGNRFGTLSAVYLFLETQFHVRWLWPGDSGIVYPETKHPILKTGSEKWVPRLLQRSIGPGYGMWRWNHFERIQKQMPPEFRLTRKQYENKVTDTFFWLRRMRMGKSVNDSFGHAFTDWWRKYSKIHPEYFALQANGRREPENPKWPHAVKLCVSNPAVIKQVVENWKKRGMPPSINTCENDSGGYCRCAECLKLDVLRPGEAALRHLSDRYVSFANRVRAEASKYRPDVTASMYAYSVYREPPRREKVEQNIAIGFVPFMMDPFDQTEQRYKGWRRAGARRLFLRPNDQYVNPGLPMGFEKRMYEHFQLGVKNGIVGTSYDSLHNYWQANGIADYILARGHINPSLSFETLLDEYCSAFGAAAPEMMKYFNYWRIRIFDSKIIQDAEKIAEIGKYGNFRRGIMWSISSYYSPADFDRTDAILDEAAGKKLSETERGRLAKIRLANTHARLMWMAVSASGDQKLQHGRNLLKFRMENCKKLDMDWIGLMEVEFIFGDICGIREANHLVGYDDSVRTPQLWYFCPDPENLGEKAGWEHFSFEKILSSWDLLSIDRAWEQQREDRIHPKLFQFLKNYDGIAWYAQSIEVKPEWRGKTIELLFGGVDESAWIWVNGRFAGKRVYSGGGEWREAFTVPITDLVDWNRKKQLVVVRVEDKAGLGGIFKNIYLVTKKK